MKVEVENVNQLEDKENEEFPDLEKVISENNKRKIIVKITLKYKISYDLVRFRICLHEQTTSVKVASSKWILLLFCVYFDFNNV